MTRESAQRSRNACQVCPICKIVRTVFKDFVSNQEHSETW